MSARRQRTLRNPLKHSRLKYVQFQRIPRATQMTEYAGILITSIKMSITSSKVRRLLRSQSYIYSSPFSRSQLRPPAYGHEWVRMKATLPLVAPPTQVPDMLPVGQTARAARTHCSQRPFEMLIVAPALVVFSENEAVPDLPGCGGRVATALGDAACDPAADGQLGYVLVVEYDVPKHCV